MIRKPDGNGILLQPHQARLRRGGNHQTNGGRRRVGINSDLFSQLQGVSLTGNGDSFVSDGCVNTTPIPRARRTSAHVIFLACFKTCVLKSTGHICVSQK